MEEGSGITELLSRASGGQNEARDQIIEILYRELHYIAGRHLNRERDSHTLSPTALVGEAYLALFGGRPPHFADRAHFLALASRVMRRILIDHARARLAASRGGQWQRITLTGEASWAEPNFDLLDLERHLVELGETKPALVELIEMYYFAGMTAEECAESTGRTVHAIRHDLRFAKAWLRREMAHGDPATSLRPEL